MIFWRGDTRNGLDPYFLAIRGNLLMFYIQNASNDPAAIFAHVPLNQWVHVAATLDDASDMMSLYVNSAKAAKSATDVRPLGTLDAGSNPGAAIGNLHSPSGLYYPFHGSIDEVALYNRALTSAEVAAIYSAGIDGKTPSSYQIAGRIVSATGAPRVGMQVNLTGATTANTTTDSNGNYVFAGLSSGSYTVTPAPQSGFTFSPTSKTLSLPTRGNLASPDGKANFTRGQSARSVKGG